MLADYPCINALHTITDNDVVDNEQCFGNCFNWFWQTVELDASTEYKLLLRHPDFPQSTEEWNPIWLAVWDDHDYGKDNSDSSNPRKLENKRAFIEFYKKLNHKQPWILFPPLSLDQYNIPLQSSVILIFIFYFRTC